jgi:AcrR family transcriptional regulator
MATADTADATRRTAEERREDVIKAAASEFAMHGYHAASTSAIARRAGISQPYIYALFPNKRELFIAVYRHGCQRIEAMFREAAAGGGTTEERIKRMGQAYIELLEDREALLVQLQGQAASGDEEIRKAVRTRFMELVDAVRRMSGADDETLLRFFANGMLLNVVAALDLPDELSPKGRDPEDPE